MHVGIWGSGSENLVIGHAFPEFSDAHISHLRDCGWACCPDVQIFSVLRSLAWLPPVGGADGMEVGMGVSMWGMHNTRQ